VALSIVVLALLISLALLGAFGRLFWGALLMFLAMISRLPVLSAFLRDTGLPPTLEYLVPLNMASAGISLVASSWVPLDRRGRNSGPLLVPFAILVASSVTVTLWPQAQLGPIEPGTIGYTTLSSLFAASCVTASWRVASVNRSLRRRATGQRERFLMAFFQTSAVTAFGGSMAILLANFLGALVPGALMQMMGDVAYAVTVSGGLGITLGLLYAAIRSLNSRRKVRRELRRILPELKETWQRIMAGRYNILYPLNGDTVEQQAYRMAVELRDAEVSDNPELEEMTEEDFILLERTEALLGCGFEED